MAHLSFTTYNYIDYVLTEEEFVDMKRQLSDDTRRLKQSYAVNYISEIRNEFSYQIIFILFCYIICLLSVKFFPNPDSLWLVGLVYLGATGSIFGTISVAVSLFSFMNYLKQKSQYSALQLYLLEYCPDHQTYVKLYYKQTLGT